MQDSQHMIILSNGTVLLLTQADIELLKSHGMSIADYVNKLSLSSY